MARNADYLRTEPRAVDLREALTYLFELLRDQHLSEPQALQVYQLERVLAALKSQEMLPEQASLELYERLVKLIVQLRLFDKHRLVDLLKLGRIEVQLTVRSQFKGKNWAVALGWFIPRKYRHVMGDILEDCAEMRQIGYTESRIKFHVVYQWFIAVITLVPTAVKTCITNILKKVLSPPK